MLRGTFPMVFCGIHHNDESFEIIHTTLFMSLIVDAVVIMIEI
jgi:hypothetical protein